MLLNLGSAIALVVDTHETCVLWRSRYWWVYTLISNGTLLVFWWAMPTLRYIKGFGDKCTLFSAIKPISFGAIGGWVDHHLRTPTESASSH
ncbi:hypothetical protein [Coleofasciculus sp. B1-GNL1-01]|uniref:hypothetical protein n=1 Tax=Coleofasciculus sp. B1-GNL1-01 TaxID=3068484 RepID=UPI0040632558